MRGAQRERTFLITELVAGLDESAPSQEDGVVERARRRGAASRRGAEGLRTGTPQEIADPIGGPAAGYRKTADEVYRLTTRVAELLFR